MKSTDRNEQLLALRPEITTDETRTSLSEEGFQNNTLRPILKFQNELLQHFFKQKVKEITVPSDTALRLAFVENTIRKDAVLRNQLIGIVIGLLSSDELVFYLNYHTSINKRIAAMLIKRIQDQF